MDAKPTALSGAQSATGISSALGTATVVGQADRWLFLDSDVSRALRAESCLLQPEVGDLVLVCAGLPAVSTASAGVAATTVPYVLAVLSRAQSGSSTVTLPGGAAIDTFDGALTLNARHITLEAADSMHTKTRSFNVESMDAKVTFNTAKTRIATLDAGIGRLTLVARSVASTVGRLVQRATESIRWIDTTDELRAGSARWRITGHAHMHTQHTTMQSEEVTRIDGSRIELG